MFGNAFEYPDRDSNPEEFQKSCEEFSQHLARDSVQSVVASVEVRPHGQRSKPHTRRIYIKYKVISARDVICLLSPTQYYNLLMVGIWIFGIIFLKLWRMGGSSLSRV